MTKILETERLIIREFEYGDIPLMIQYSKEEARKKELPDEIFDTVEKAMAQVEMCLENYKEKKYPLPYAIDLKEFNIFIGHILLCPIEKGVEIGYFISERYQNNGYATEAVKSFVKWAKPALNLNTIYGDAKKSNIASWKALEKAGFQFAYEKEENCYGGVYTCRFYTC
ncbi:MAG: GNAT family N-acetyltransferase [Oscillospiraceae bacterium]|nr:GNAT family N-acetyltransferase [Oscillospiraceae bacterium]